MESFMEEPNKSILIKNSLNRSKQALNDAEYNYKDGRNTTALNRIYYAIFYAVMALAYKEGFITSSHTQLMGWFNKKFIYEEKVFEPILNDIYKYAYKQRQESDYNLMTSKELSNEFVAKELQNAKMFIKTIEEYLTKEKDGEIEKKKDLQS